MTSPFLETSELNAFLKKIKDEQSKLVKAKSEFYNFDFEAEVPLLTEIKSNDQAENQPSKQRFTWTPLKKDSLTTSILRKRILSENGTDLFLTKRWEINSPEVKKIKTEKNTADSHKETLDE